MPGWWVANLWSSQGPVAVVSWVVWVIGSIVLHELAHGWAALRCGDPTPRERGHITANPLVHMGPTSLVFFALVGIAWGAMPVNPSRFRGRYDDVIVALAGPAMNVSLLAIATVVLALWIGHGPAAEPLRGNVADFLYHGVLLNAVLAIFNMLPVPPLDGSRVLAGAVPAYARLIADERAQVATVVIFLGLFLFAGPYLWSAGAAVADGAIDAAMSVLAARRAP